jgi:hypothetical protein
VVDQDLAGRPGALAYVQGVVASFQTSSSVGMNAGAGTPGDGASASLQGSGTASGGASASPGGTAVAAGGSTSTGTVSTTTGPAGSGATVTGAGSSSAGAASSSGSAGVRFLLEQLRVDASNAVIDPLVTGNGVCVVVSGELDANGVLIAKSVTRLDLGAPTY